MIWDGNVLRIANNFGNQFNNYFQKNFGWQFFTDFKKFITISVQRNYICFFLTAQKMKFSIKDFFSKCDQIRSFLNQICSIRMLIMSCCWLYLGQRFFGNIASIGIEESVLVVFIESCWNFTCIVVKSTLFSERFFNSLALYLKFEINLLSWNSGGMKVIVPKHFQNLPTNLWA